MNPDDNWTYNASSVGAAHEQDCAGTLGSAMVVGLGSVGLRHLANLRELGVQRLIAVSTGRSTHPKLADAIAGVAIETTLDAGLAHDPELVVIATPTSMHLEQSLVCARAGRHLLIEKPLSHTVEGLDELQRAVELGRVTAMVGFQFRFHPLMRRLRGWVRSGRLGVPLHANARWGEDLPGFHPWEDYRSSYAAREELGGGVIRTLIHPLDYLAFLLGNVREAHATVRACRRLDTNCPDDAAVVTMTHAGGAISATTLDFAQRPAVHTLDVVGEDARAALDFNAGKLVLTPGCGEPEVVSVPAGFGRNALFRDELSHLITQITLGSRYTDSPVADSASLLSVVLGARLEAIERSRRETLAITEVAA
jgi:predicted dehydrogenase